MRINRDSVSWNAWDPESVRNSAGGVHHGASAVQNLRAIGEDAAHAALPDRAIVSAYALGKLNPVFGVIGFVLGFLLDLLELIAFPFMVVKNLIDIGAHGTKAAVNAAKAEAEVDGEVERTSIRSFHIFDAPSATRQLQGLHSVSRGVRVP